MKMFILLSFLSACLELAFQEYQEEKMIFDWYKKLLVKFSKDKSLWKKKIALVLGLCSYCNGFWVSVGIYLYYFKFDLLLLLFCGLNFIFIKVLLGLIKILK